MLRHLRTRRRPRYGAHVCALLAAILLLLSVSLLHSRLTFFNSHPQHLPLSQDSLSLNPLLDDLDSYSLTTSNSNDDRIDELDDTSLDININNNNDEAEPEEEDEESNQNQNPGVSSNYFFDPITGVVRRSYNKRSIEEWEDYVPFNSKLRSDLGLDSDNSKAVYGSDDILVDEKLRNKLSEVKKLEDALLLKGSVLREGWGEWFDKKGDFLRRDRMFKSNIEVLNPMNNPILQDPDGVGVTVLTRGDKIVQKSILNEFKKTPFLIKKTLSVFDSRKGHSGENFNTNGRVMRVERKTLGKNNGSSMKNPEGLEKVLYADGKRWGYYPGLDGRLSFGDFMEEFFRRGRCTMKIFMVWNSPAWMFGVRQQRGLESLLYHNKNACVVVFSETIELNFFSGFLKDGYKIAVVMPNLDELLKDTPTHIFASVWHEWKKTKYYPTHYSELVRLAALYKYGGIYLDSDIIVLKPLSSLNNTVGMEDEFAGRMLNGAVMAFRKHSPFILECLNEFYGSYDDTSLRLNGADLLTRVADKFLSNKDIFEGKMELQLQSQSLFFPINGTSISRYFYAPRADTERLEQDVMFKKILDKSVTFHFWNSLTSALIPEPDSLVSRLLNKNCIHCSDML